jgi:hypothetical protein
MPTSKIREVAETEVEETEAESLYGNLYRRENRAVYPVQDIDIEIGHGTRMNTVVQSISYDADEGEGTVTFAYDRDVAEKVAKAMLREVALIREEQADYIDPFSHIELGPV